jgi:23S rRNA (uracil1939-C5)-methyltransferase
MARIRAEATITSVAPGGSGVAHVAIAGERRAVFVPNAAPGDVIRAEVDPAHRPARGRLLELVTPGPDRVPPACAWSVRCGGCDWMHLSPDAQARFHVEHVREALPQPWRDAPIASVTAPQPLGYRVRARVHVRCERGRVEVGMHEAGTRDPVSVDACAVLDPMLERARRALAPIFRGSKGRGEVVLALGKDRIPVLDVHWKGELATPCFASLDRNVTDSLLAGARVTLEGASRPAVIGDPTPWLHGPDGAPLRLAPGGFSKASEHMNAVLARHVADATRGHEADRAVELFAGAGNLSVLLARRVAALVAVESSREACDAARDNLRSRGLTAKVVEGDAEAYTWSASTRLVVLDPPRTGARAVAERLARSNVARIVYVSCDAQTLGRDLAILAGRYEPASIAVLEMFPQTSHGETVAVLQRVRKASP